jgi:hypothetical protein
MDIGPGPLAVEGTQGSEMGPGAGTLKDQEVSIRAACRRYEPKQGEGET